MVNLFPHYGSQLLRVILASDANEVVVVTEGSTLGASRIGKGDGPLDSLVAAKYEAHVRRGAGRNRPAILVLEKRGADGLGDRERVLRYVMDRHAAKVRNSWREGLIEYFSDRGRTVTKREAVRTVEEVAPPGIVLEAYPTELPLFVLEELPAAVARSVERLEVLEANREGEAAGKYSPR